MLDEIPKPINLLQSPYIIIIYLFCFLLLGINFVISNRFFGCFLLDFFKIKSGENKDTAINKVLTGFVGSVGFILFALISLNKFIPNILVKDGKWDYLQVGWYAAIIFGTFVAYLTYKLLIIKILQKLFNINSYNVSSYLNMFVDTFVNLGVILFLLSFVDIYFVMPTNIILTIVGVGLIVFFLIKVTINTLQFFSFGANTLYLFFLYLCTLEILPILVLIKVFSVFIV